VTARPVWFGPQSRPLFGWRHDPDGPVRGGVVLCPAVGFEHVVAYRTFVVLARRLAAAGFVVLRFDYDGTGDSAGDHTDPGRVEAWQRSIADAVGEVRAAGVEHVALVGLRVGALLAGAVAARRDDVDAVVLWDPVASGRAFIRQSKMLQVVGVGAAEPGDTGLDDGAFEAAGQVFTKETTDALSAVDLTKLDAAIAPRVLALLRTDRPAGDAFLGALRSANPSLELGDATAQAGLFDQLSVEFASVPEPALDTIVDWLTAAFAPGTPVEASAETPPTAVVAHSPDGDPILERAVHLGPAGLFAIVTERDGATGPFVICLNYGVAHHIGPSRLWVDLARRWAAAGLRVARFDLSGIGDSPARPGRPEHTAYLPEAFDDVVDAATALAGDPHDVVLVGVCSGAYLAIDLAAVSGVRGICAVNPNLRFKPADLFTAGGDDTGDAPVEVRRAQPPTRSLIRRVSTSRFGDDLQRRVPPIGWHALHRFGIHASPANALERMRERDVDVFLAYGSGDDGLYQLRRRGGYVVRRLSRSPAFRLHVEEGMDHLLMLRRQRERLADVLTRHVVERFAPVQPLADASTRTSLGAKSTGSSEPSDIRRSR
jgi:alpha-beta hydrolase superfamily lysophospholipase